MKINNLPTNYTNYAYITARFVEGAWWFYGAWRKSYEDAVAQAEEIEGAVFRAEDIKPGH